jgi:uncharacterized protein involved in tolerance to divalent cations
MRIKGSTYVTKDGQIYVRQILTCRKKSCSNFNKDVKSIYTPLGNLVEDSDAGTEDE